ncbi:hypothetical protein NL676_024795 [Syzygium grande]|nr:hypothetical protein NL676_024795 [Syzygium grande]
MRIARGRRFVQDIATSEKATEGCNDPGSKELSSSPGRISEVCGSSSMSDYPSPEEWLLKLRQFKNRISQFIPIDFFSYRCLRKRMLNQRD